MSKAALSSLGSSGGFRARQHQSSGRDGVKLAGPVGPAFFSPALPWKSRGRREADRPQRAGPHRVAFILYQREGAERREDRRFPIARGQRLLDRLDRSGWIGQAETRLVEDELTDVARHRRLRPWHNLLRTNHRKVRPARYRAPPPCPRRPQHLRIPARWSKHWRRRLHRNRGDPLRKLSCCPGVPLRGDRTACGRTSSRAPIPAEARRRRRTNAHGRSMCHLSTGHRIDSACSRYPLSTSGLTHARRAATENADTINRGLHLLNGFGFQCSPAVKEII